MTERQAALRRLSGDVDAVVSGLGEMMGPPAAADLDRATVDRLAGALAGVGRGARGRRGHRSWPTATARVPRPAGRWCRAGASCDPTRCAGCTCRTGRRSNRPTRAGRRRSPRCRIPTAAQRSALGLAVRTVSDKAGDSLPAPWPAAVAEASRSRLGDLPDALDRAVAGTDLGMGRTPIWWRLVGGIQWLVTLAALGGLLWLLAGYAVRAIGLPRLEYPMVGNVPLPTMLLLGGLVLGLLVALLVRPIIGWAARRARRRAEARLRAAVGEVGREQVVAPVRDVLKAYGEARDALATAAR